MLQPRPPIVVILGHVDHGKTSLLDYLRKSNVAAGEAGGITQHIRSFQLTSPIITFVDTPGHAAFSSMRERGSKLADLAILIISGVDGVMPQTIESINFIKTSNLPFVVAITKSDLPGFDPQHVKLQLSENQVFVEDMGGDVPVVSVSVKTGLGIPELLEILGLLNDLNPAKSDPNASLECVVLESRLDSKKGPLAAAVVRSGTLKTGQTLFQQAEIGKARALTSSTGESLTQALPSVPVEILGLSQIPEVGSIISDHPLTQNSQVIAHHPNYDPNAPLRIILKTDVIGSQEAISWSLPSGVTILSGATGDISENDILEASANGAQVIAFNVRCPSGVAKLAEVEKVSVHTFQIIYELLDYLREFLAKREVEVVTAKAEILADFHYNNDHVAGSKVTEGRLNKTDNLKLLRGGKVVGLMKFKSLKTGKTDLVAAKVGTEFGAIFSPPLDFRVGDTIIAFTLGHG